MNILFLIIPVAFLVVAMVTRLTTRNLTKSLALVSDQRGVTLETVIVTAVLALAAAGAGVIIYNVVGDNTTKIKANADTACETAGTVDTFTLGTCVPKA